MGQRLPKLDTDPVTRIWMAGALFMVALFVSTLPAYWIDERTTNGVSVWLKPIKFQVSLAIQFMSVALLAQLVIRSTRTSLVFLAGTYVVTAALIFEIVYIMAQAGRGRASHFNLDTPFEALMYNLMGLGAVILVLVPMILGVLIWRRTDDAATEETIPGLRLGAILGLLVSGVLTLIVAGYMSINGGHWVGPATSDVSGLPLVGWSREVGDLRVAHFFATHAMQVLPVLGLIADRIPGLPARPTVWTGTILWIALTLALFLQALAGDPLVPRS
ncbi:MAG: hypothetical protein ACFB6R_17940 [Alphaproteobacteria bacterium]